MTVPEAKLSAAVSFNVAMFSALVPVTKTPPPAVIVPPENETVPAVMFTAPATTPPSATVTVASPENVTLSPV